MALTQEQLDALEALPMRSSGLMLEPTLMASHYRPLLALPSADPADLLEYGRARGWTDFEVGHLLGAAQFMWLIGMTGSAEWGEVLDRRTDAGI